MKKTLMIIYILSFLAIFAGCVGKGFVLENVEATMIEGYETTSVSTNISQALQASEIEYFEEIAAVTAYAYNENAAYVRHIQEEIFREFTNFSIINHEIDLIGGNVVSDPAEYNTDYAQEVKEPAGYIAMTFDDGPHPTLTPLLLDALYERDIRATFFLLGLHVDKHPYIVERMHNEGHSIGNHSYRHPRFTGINRQRMVSEIESTNRAIYAATGSMPTLLRPPYGARNNTVLDVARQMNMSVVLWSVDPRDWDHRNAPIVRDNILNITMDGSIVLLHDIHETSIEAAVLAIDELLERGYVFVTVEELFELSELTLQAGQVYRSIYHSIGVSQ